MLIYNYSPDTFELNFVSDAIESPLEPGVFLVPAFATVVEPPIDALNMRAIFDEATQTWSLVEDWRNSTVWDIATGLTSYTIIDLGPIPSDYTLTKPATISSNWSTDASQQTGSVITPYYVWNAVGQNWDFIATPILEQIFANIDAKQSTLQLSNNVQLVSGDVFKTDVLSRTQYNMLKANPSLIAGEISTVSGAYITLTTTLIDDILAAIIASDAVLVAYAQSQKAAAIAAPSPDAFEWYNGWPTIYIAP